MIFFSAKEDRIQSIDCGTESSKCYKKLNESVKNNHKNEFSKYLEDSNERKDKRFKAEDPKVIPKSIFSINNSKIWNYETENYSNIEKPSGDQPGSEDKSAFKIPIEKSLFLCNICGISYSFKEHLKLHVERFHLGYFICHLCNKTFLGKPLLDEHLISVHEEKKKILKCIRSKMSKNIPK